MAGAGLTACGVTAIVPGPPPVEQAAYTYGEERMNNRILVVYATATGSTAEVAAAMGETLAGHGLSVDVRPVCESPEVEGYRVVLIGSAVQYGTWLPEAVDFVRANRHGARLMLPGWIARFVPTLDFRTWDKIRAWADSRAEEFTPS